MPPEIPDPYFTPAPSPSRRGIDSSERVRQIASRANISPDIAEDYLKTTKIESGHNVNVRDSSKGAQGFGQVLPDVKGGTTRTVGGHKYNLRNPDENIEAGLKYFAEGGPDPTSRRLYYFGGPKARKHYEETGQIPNISDGNMTATQYVRATGGGMPNAPVRQSQREKLTQQPTQSDPYFTPDTPLPQGRAVAIARVATTPQPQTKRADKGWGTGTIGQGVTGGVIPQGARAEGEVSYTDADKVRNAVRAAAPPGFGLLPRAAQEAVGEQLAKGASGLTRMAAGVVRGVPHDPFAGKNQITDQSANKLNTASQVMASGGTQMEKQANRPTVHVPVLGDVGMQDVYNIGGGAISSAPAMVLTSLGIPAPVAFGLQSYLESTGRDADWKDVLKETGMGAATGALFEIPLPARMALLAKIGAKLGIVGGGTYGIEKLAGMPEAEARKNAAVNALFGASGVKSERPEIKVPIQTVPESMQGRVRLGDIAEQAKQVGATVLNPEEVVAGGKPKIRTALREGVNETQPQPNVATQPESTQSANVLARTSIPRAVEGTSQPDIRSAVPESAAGISRPVRSGNEISSGESPRHVDLQPRRQRGEGKGQFKAESTAQAEARRAQVSSEQPNAIPPPEWAMRAEDVRAAKLAKLRAQLTDVESTPVQSIPGNLTRRRDRSDLRIANEAAALIEEATQLRNRIKAIETAPPDAVKEAHRGVVDAALRQGKPVPPEVLADYPDLATQAARQPKSREVPKPPVVSAATESGIFPPQESLKTADPYFTPEPSTTSAKKAQMSSDRAELDLPELPPAERKSWRTSLDNAKPEKAGLLADEVLTKPRALNDEETASLVVRAQEIKNEHSQAMKEIGASTDPETIQAKKAQADALEREFDKITRATKASGTEKGRALAAQKLTINQDFDLVSVKQRMKAAKGRELTPEESKRYALIVEERDQAIVDRDKAIEEARTAKLQREIGKVQRQRVRTETKQALDTEAATIKSNIAAEFMRLKSQQSKVLSQGGLGNLDPEGVITKELIRYARNRVKANIEIKAEQLIDDIHSLVKDFTDTVSRREIAELVSGYKMTAPERKPDDVRRLGEIRSEIKSLLGAEDVAAGVRSARREGPTKGEARKSGIPLQGPKMSEARRLPAEGPRLSEGIGTKAGPQLGAKQGPRLGEGIGQKEGPSLGPKQGPTLREGVGRKEGPELGSRQGPRMAEARKLPAEGPPRQLFGRNQARLKQLQKQEAELNRKLNEGNFTGPTKKEPIPYTREVYAKEKQVREIEERFNREMYRATRGTTGKIIDTAAGFGNIPKTMLSMADVSAVLRQGGIGVYQHPVLSGRAGMDMLKSFTSHGFANVENAIKNSPRFDQAKRSGVEFTGIDKDNPQLSKHEEGYLGSGGIDTLAKGRVNPLRLVKGVKDFSERTFVSFLDSQRMRIFENQAKALEDMGLKGRELDGALKSQARYINIITGRGSLGVKGNQAAPALNVALFSPRLIASRVQFLNKMINPVSWANTPKGARKLQMIDNAKFLFGLASTLALAKAAGADVSLDPDDSEFLKIKAGNTRYDTLAGLQQPMRFMYRMTRAMKGGETYEGADKGKILGDFARSKAAPLAGYAADYFEGKNRLSGKKFEAGKDLVRNVIPLPFQDFQDAIKEDGTVKGIVEAFPTLLGVGVQTYPTAPEKATTKAEKLARKFIGDTDEGRTSEEIDLDQKKSALRAQSRKGIDVTENLKALKDLVTDKQAKSILGSRGQTRLQEDVKRLPLYDPQNHRDVLTVYSTMSPSEQESVKKIVGEKAATVDLLPMEQQKDVRDRLVKLGFKPGLNIPRPPPRPQRPDKPNQRAWSYQQ